MPLTDPIARLQRARGRVEIAVSRRRGAVRLDRLFQSGSAKALLPRVATDVPEAVLINTAGGLTGGDRYDYALTVGPGAALVVATQTAERIYRSVQGDAEVATAAVLGAGAALDWLPQETILFEAGRLRRSLSVTMAEDARLLALESLVLGRRAMGETLASGLFSDQWRIRRAGRLVHAEALHLYGDLVRATAGDATLGGARALATLVWVSPDAEARRDAARILLADLAGVQAAATARDGVLILRFLAADNAPLRAALIRFLMAFRGDPLPRVWTM